MKYELVTAETETLLSDLVTRRLSHGWELYGSPVVMCNEESYTLFAQAVIIRNDV